MSCSGAAILKVHSGTFVGSYCCNQDCSGAVKPQGTFRYLRSVVCCNCQAGRVCFRIGGWSCWLESDSATSSGIISVGIGGRGADGWNPTQLPFPILCIIGIGGWSCWLESDSATSLGLVFGLVVEVLLVGIRLSYRSRVYHLDLWLIAVGWNSDSATYPICVSPALCWKPAQRRQLYSSINGGFRRR